MPVLDQEFQSHYDPQYSEQQMQSTLAIPSFSLHFVSYASLTFVLSFINFHLYVLHQQNYQLPEELCGKNCKTLN